MDEGSASLALDELTIYFFNNDEIDNPNFDAYVATRRSIDEPFGAPTAIAAVQSGSDDRGGWIAADELAFYFYSSRNGTYDLFVSTRASTASAFGEPEALPPTINTEALEQNPSLVPDGTSMYFSRDGGIYRSELGGNGFGAATPVGELNVEQATTPVISSDGLTIYFGSGRTGGAGGQDIWRATRDDVDGSFVDIVNVSELNLDDFEFPEWISPDGCRLYFTSRRPGGTGGWDMWVATREPG